MIPSQRVIGRNLGGYRLVAHIGSGGMGAVYRGEHGVLGSDAAIKVLLPEYSHKQQLVRRFLNEARAVAQAQHPGIVDIFDFGTSEDGVLYLVMDLLEGETLAERLRRDGKLDEALALAIAAQMAAALAAAHAAGIVHRDLKPSNVFLVPAADRPSGLRVVLVDFGVAKLVGDKGDDAMRTRTGVIVGTPLFMAPEQCKGGGAVIDWRADIYALGCLLFAMVAGRPPFRGAGPGQAMARQIHDTPPRLASLAEVSSATDQLVARLLAKKPEQRATHISQVADELRQLVAELRRAAHGGRAADDFGDDDATRVDPELVARLGLSDDAPAVVATAIASPNVRATAPTAIARPSVPMAAQPRPPRSTPRPSQGQTAHMPHASTPRPARAPGPVRVEPRRLSPLVLLLALLLIAGATMATLIAIFGPGR